MTISASVSAPIPEWLVAYHDWLAWASRVNPWPLQARPSPQQRAAEVEPPLSGAAAQAAIQLRRDTPNFYRKAEK